MSFLPRAWNRTEREACSLAGCQVRCWTVYKGALAPQAAGVIHTDFEKGFIKAEVVGFEDFKAVTTKKGMAEVKVRVTTLLRWLRYLKCEHHY